MTQKKCLCFVATDAISFNVLYRGQLEYLNECGHNLTLVCGGASDELQALRKRNVGTVVSVDLVRPPRPLADLRALFQLARHFGRKRYDTVVVTTPKAILLGALAAGFRRQPRRVVFFQGRVYENFSGAIRMLYHVLDRLAAACAHEILFVSSSLMAEYCRDAPVYARKGRVLGAGSGNGVSGARMDPQAYPLAETLALRGELGLSADDFVALAIGRICVDKGLAELDALAERAAREDPGIRLVMIGPVEIGSEPTFARLMARGNVVHVGFTPDVARYLALADVHLFLTHREGFGNVAVEAAAMNVPTIAFDVVGVRDSVADGVSGIRVPLGDVNAAWDALQVIRRHPEDASRRYAGARRWALENFAQERVWEQYGEFYERD